MKLLENSIAVISGGGSGMGQRTALEFLNQGARVFILGRTEKKLQNTVCLSGNNPKIEYAVCDVSKKDQVERFFDSLADRGIVVNLVVNCAGVINVKKNNGEMDDETVINVNLLGTMNVCDCSIKKMIQNKIKGSVINIASIAGHDGSSEFPSYAASKGAVLAYTKSIAMIYGEYGVRINSISPGVVVTPMSYVETPNYDDYIPELISMHPLKRLGKPEDIAQTALFLASSMSDWITGQDITVDGGYTLRE